MLLNIQYGVGESLAGASPLNSRRVPRSISMVQAGEIALAAGTPPSVTTHKQSSIQQEPLSGTSQIYVMVMYNMKIYFSRENFHMM